MYEYKKNNRFYAKIAEGILEPGAEELSGLGARHIRTDYGGIYFTANKEALYRINYFSRLTSRILAPLVSFNCCSTDDVYDKGTQVNWSDFMSLKSTFAVFCNVSGSRITNSHFASLRLKDGIVDSFLATSGNRPNVNAKKPDVWLNLHIKNDRAVISLDTSGGSLHRRGYRKESIEAPMQETVAAAIIRYSGWCGQVPLYDPMCGSGTLLCEALMHYCNIPSSMFREQFGFQCMPDYDEKLWKMVKKELDRQIRELPEGLIAGNDSSRKALIITGKNLQNLPNGDKVRLEGLDFRKSTGLENGIIVTNPPYGIRMGNRQHLDSLYQSLGDFLKHKCRGSSAYIYFGERELIKKIGLKPAWKKPLKTGGLEGRLVKYELY